MTSGGGGGVGGSRLFGDFSGTVLASVQSAFSSDNVRPKDPHTSSITVIIFARPSGHLEMTAASSAYSVPHTALRTRSKCLCPPTRLLVDIYPALRMMSSSRNRTRPSSSSAAKRMLRSSGDITHPRCSPCVTLNQAESSPSSIHTRVCMPLWNGRITSTISS